MAYQLTMASYQKWDRDRELAQNRPLRRYLESKVPTDEKIEALESALASLKAEVREESVRRSGSHLLELMDRLEPVGALVSLRALRQMASYLDKPAFDALVVQLATYGLVNLHRHDWPAALTEDEKWGMVPDGRGGYFVGVARRAVRNSYTQTGTING